MTDHRFRCIREVASQSYCHTEDSCARKSLIAVVCCTVVLVGIQCAIACWGSWCNIARFHAASASTPRSHDSVLVMLALVVINVTFSIAVLAFFLAGCILNYCAPSSRWRKTAVFIALAVLLGVSYWVSFHMDIWMQSRFGRVRTLPSVAPQHL